MRSDMDRALRAAAVIIALDALGLPSEASTAEGSFREMIRHAQSQAFTPFSHKLCGAAIARSIPAWARTHEVPAR